jgi:hypothetical protein
MTPLLTFSIGAVIFGLTFAAWVYLNALGCAMNTTGCSNLSLHWTDFETLRFFLPTFAIGAFLMALALWRWRRR